MLLLFYYGTVSNSRRHVFNNRISMKKGKVTEGVRLPDQQSYMAKKEKRLCFLFQGESIEDDIIACVGFNLFSIFCFHFVDLCWCSRQSDAVLKAHQDSTSKFYIEINCSENGRIF